MTLYAHTTAGTIDQVGALPALWLGPTRWHDWRGDPETWATQPADWGWLPVVEVPRPADTATTTSDPAPVALVAGVPTQQWTVRPWTAEELTAREQADAERVRYETHEAILKGDRVGFNGSNYESLIDGNTWSPTAYPQGWLKL